MLELNFFFLFFVSHYQILNAPDNLGWKLNVELKFGDIFR